MKNLPTKEFCTGCTACAAICPKGCIAMAADENGFLHPVVNTASCVNCGLCTQVCPVVTPLPKNECAPRACAAYSTDEQMRLQSSSGGVFTEIARAVLAKGGVVYGAAYNENFEVVHVCAKDEAGLAGLRGAKYAQSNLRGAFADVKAHLESGTQVLFSGTPCQVAGLKAFLRKDYANLLTVDFVCHSVPSPMAWKAYVAYRAQQDNGGELPQQIELRSKETGWSRYGYSNLFRYANGSRHMVGNGSSLYIKLFVGGYISRECCANCRFKGYSRCSDLTLGDFWGIWDIAPEMDDNKGTSVVLVQSARGEQLLSEISGKLVLRDVMPEEASRQNQAMLCCAQANPRREEVLANVRAGNWQVLSRWMEPQKPSLLRRVRSLAGRVLRKLKLRK